MKDPVIKDIENKMLKNRVPRVVANKILQKVIDYLNPMYKLIIDYSFEVSINKR